MYHSMLFTGHMIDAEGRESPRFPADKENIVRQEIKKHLVKEKEIIKNELKGIAGGACGGDILFHELCEELNIPSEIYLALQVEAFKKESVSFAGNGWEDRFERLIRKLPVYVLSADNNGGSVWERTNLWMLDVSLKNGGKNMSLLAVWDGKAGDGGGGTEHMVNVSKEQGAGIAIIDINKL